MCRGSGFQHFRGGGASGTLEKARDNKGRWEPNQDIPRPPPHPLAYIGLKASPWVFLKTTKWRNSLSFFEMSKIAGNFRIFPNNSRRRENWDKKKKTPGAFRGVYLWGKSRLNILRSSCTRWIHVNFRPLGQAKTCKSGLFQDTPKIHRGSWGRAFRMKQA